MDSNSEKMFKILFDIEFNNKKFSIFIDEYGRRTFLEIDKDGKYIYPILEDFIMLHRIYNERDIFVSYDSDKNNYVGYRLPRNLNKRTFKEYVRVTTGMTAYVLSAIIIANSICGVFTGKKYNLVQNKDGISITIDYDNELMIENPNELNETLGYSLVSKDDVINVVNENTNLSDYYKKEIIIFLEHMVSKYPNTDMRVFYENMKTLKIDIVQQFNSKNISGCYNSYTNTISIREDYLENKEVFYHELAHAYHTLTLKEVRLKFKGETFGYSLAEAMTNQMIEGLVDSPFSYKDEAKVLNYLCSNVSYNYIDYEKYGIAKLVELLKIKYPDVDIDYIISSMDSMHDTEINMDKSINLVDNKYLIDELFNICVRNIDINKKGLSEVYRPYIEFKQLVGYGMSVSGYSSKYNEILLHSGFSSDEIINENIDSELFAMDVFAKYIDQLTYTDIDEEDIYGPFREYMIINEEILLPQKSSKLMIFDKIDKYNEFLRKNGVEEDRIISSEKIQYELNKYTNIEDFENIDINISIPIETLFDNFIVVIKRNDSNIEFRVKARNESKKEINANATNNYMGEKEIHISLRDYIQIYIKNNVDLNLNEILNCDYLYTYLVDKKGQYSDIDLSFANPLIDLWLENLSQNKAKVV